jgi:hypothetical protein
MAANLQVADRRSLTTKKNRGILKYMWKYKTMYDEGLINH